MEVLYETQGINGLWHRAPSDFKVPIVGGVPGRIARFEGVGSSRAFAGLLGLTVLFMFVMIGRMFLERRRLIRTPYGVREGFRSLRGY
jgi:hypothetical protein